MYRQIHKVSYDRAEITPGILHIGVGNFHRAHEAYYTDLLLSKDKTQSDWGICGAMLLPGDEKLFETLQKQNRLYTVTAFNSDGTDYCRQIGSIIDLVWAGEHPEAVIKSIADPDIRIITLTITEGGYNIDKTSGKFRLDTPAVKKDLENPLAPETVFGFVAEGLRRRIESGAGSVTILSCDNLRHNGDVARLAFMSFFMAQDYELFRWAVDNVSFPNCMVDRITPAVHPDDILRLDRHNGSKDKAPVYCESYIEWVIEDNFLAGRPAWEEVGVRFTDDVTPYENMKLSLLNASHTLISYPSFLAGFRNVADAVRNPVIAKFVRDFMDKDMTPYVVPPQGVDLLEYKDCIMNRLANNAVADQLSRLCFDGLSKFPVYIVPGLAKMIEDKKDITRPACLIAAYRHYLKFHRDDNGTDFGVAEPTITETDLKLIASDNPLDFLKLDAFAGAGLCASEDFKNRYLEMDASISRVGVMQTLKSITDAG